MRWQAGICIRLFRDFFASISAVLADWSDRIASEFDGVALFDLPSGGAIYRVFLFPGCLQVDLSFAPSTDFGATGPEFRRLFGTSVDKPVIPAPTASHLFGYGVHHAVRARVCLERGRWWQAEYWTSALRDYALTLACVRLNLAPHYGKGFDDLPEDLRRIAAAALPRSVERRDVLSALREAAGLLLAEGMAASVCPTALRDWVREFVWME